MKKFIPDTSLPSDKQIVDEIRPFVRSATGRRVLRSLFYEAQTGSAKESDATEPIFTLKNWNMEKEGKKYWSLKNIYMSYDHIPGFEYEFALKIFGEWDHWTILANSDVIRDHIQAWRDEMAIKMAAKGYKALVKTAVYEGSKGTPAAKILADRGWEAKRGRPSKEEIARSTKIAAGISDEIAEDMERLGLSLVKGGKK